MYALAIAFIVFVTVAAQSQVQSAAYSAQVRGAGGATPACCAQLD